MFNERSQGRVQGVDPRLVEILLEARRRTGIPFEVSEGMRSRDRQKELLAAGKSQTMNSRHLHGNAIDIHILNPDGSVTWDFEAYRPIADAANAIAAEKGYGDFVWGGDWKSLKDGVHFQIGGRHNGGGYSAPAGGSGAPAPQYGPQNALASMQPEPQQNQLRYFQPKAVYLDPRDFMVQRNYLA